MPRNYFYLVLAALAISTLTACSNGSGNGSGTGGQCGLVQPIAPTEVVTGMLEEDDCTAEEIYPLESSGDPSFIDEYSIVLPANGTLTITMTSTEINPILFLVSSAESCSAGCVASIIIASDNDSGGGQNAFITMDLAAGTYGIQANALGTGPGAYSLQTTFTP